METLLINQTGKKENSFINPLIDPALSENKEVENANIFNYDFSGIDIAPVNVIETNVEYILEMIAPGLEIGGVLINVNKKGVLTLSVNIDEDEDDDMTVIYRRKEFTHTSFSRSFQLPKNIDIDGIVPNYKNGVITLILPKLEELEENVTEIEEEIIITSE